MIARSVIAHRIILTLAAAGLLVETRASGNQPVSMPLEFEANTGQFAPEVHFLAHGANHFVYLTRDGMTLGFNDARQRNTSLRMTLVGATTGAALSGEAPTAGVSNYLIGNDPAQWHRDVGHYARVRYSGVWRGIDLLFYGKDQSLEYDFIVYPGADPGAIRLRYENARSLRLDANGDLLLETEQGEVRQRRPQIYQVSKGIRRDLSGRYRIDNGRELRLDIQGYDRNLNLVIDPVLTYSTYIGGTGMARLNAMSLDSAGNIYVTGRVSSPDFPVARNPQPASGGIGLYRSQDRAATWTTAGSSMGSAKVLSLVADPQNNAVIYSGTSHGLYKSADAGATWKAASGLPPDAVTAVAVDPPNPATVYACMSEGLYQSKDSGVTWKALLTGPVTSVAAAATRSGWVFAGRPGAPILRSQDGGVNWQEVSPPVSVNALAIDPTNALTVYAGTSRSGILLSTDGGATWTYSNRGMTRGSAPLPIYAIAIDPRIPQRLYAGTANGLYRSSDWGADWAPAGSGIGTRSVLSLAINPLDANYVYAGTARAGVFQSVDGGDNWTGNGPANLDANAVTVDSAARSVYTGLYLGTQAFVTKLNPAANALVYSTYIGGSGDTDGGAIAVDDSGRTYVCGATDAPDFPTRNPYQPGIGGGRDVFFLRLNISGSGLDYSSFFGGRGDDACKAAAVDADGNLYLAGNTYAMPTGINDFPTTLNAFQPAAPGGDQDCFVAKFDDTGHRLTYSTYLGGAAVDSCNAMVVDRSGNVFLAGATTSPNFPLLQPSLGGIIPGPPVLTYSSGFVARLNSDGAALSNSALLGGLKGDTEVNGLLLNSIGRIYLTGYTKASDFPFSSNALSSTVLRNAKSFVSVVDSAFLNLVYSTVLPGPGPDSAAAIQHDGFGNAWIIGTASTSQFQTTPDAIAHPPTSDPTPFVAHLDVAASKLLHSTYLAGTAGGAGTAIAVSPEGRVYVAGSTLSTDFPATAGPFQSARTTDYAIFLQSLDFTQTPPPVTPVAPAVAAVVNGASFAAASLSPGAAITVTGTNLAAGAAESTSVTINGQNVPLFYVSPTQINGQLPFEIQPGPATLKVTVNSVASTAFPITVTPAAPGIFLTGTNRAAATNPDTSVNAANNPAPAGAVVTVYFTGLGPLDHPVPTGAPAPLDTLCKATLPVTVTVGGQVAEVLFAGLTPGSVSLAQANVVLPNLPAGDYPIQIKVGTASSNAPLISIAAK
uniref:Uncharacterized protein n=1 Tax=Solibacter usitatus (strain Ellin6076) TaxID=234267 RepID=Q01T38_SOLUE